MNAAIRTALIGWRAWYSEGTEDQRRFVVYASSTHRWRDLPAVGLQAVALYQEPPCREIISGCDLYAMIGDDMVAVGDGAAVGVRHDLIEHALELYPQTSPSDWKLGVTIGSDDYERIQRAALAAEDPPQTDTVTTRGS